MPVISVLNLKGGSGKTTVSTNLSVAFAEKGKKVMLIDTDKQGSSLQWMGQRPDDKIKVNIISITDPGALRKQISDFRKMFDLIVIDGAPHVDVMASATIALSDLIILPVLPSPYDIWATEIMVERIKNAQEVNPAIKAFFLINRFSERTILSQETSEALDKLELKTLKNRIGNRVSYADSALQGMSVLEWTNDKAADEIRQLQEETEELI